MLYVSNRVQLSNILFGGKQERGLRPGTEHIALALGMARALRTIGIERNSARKIMQNMRDDFARKIVAHVPGNVINSPLDTTLPHMLNVSIKDVDAEYVTLALSERGVSISTKSACREGEERESHVIRALIGTDDTQAWRAKNAFRFSLGRNTRRRHLDRVLQVFKTCVDLSRSQKNV
jgi:cysteine desulfurase